MLRIHISRVAQSCVCAHRYICGRRSFSLNRQAVSAFLAAVMAAGLSSSADARLTQITITSSSVVDFPVFGATGPYLKLYGTYTGELDPHDPVNSVIADIALAPRVNGKVQYTSTFAILRPVNLNRSNRKLFYDFGNRGNKYLLTWFNDTPSDAAANDPTTATDFGNGFLMRQGYTVAWNGWAGDVAPEPNLMSITLPVAQNDDGTPITGQTVAETTQAAPFTTMTLPYEASSMSPSNGVLTVRQYQLDQRIPLSGWSWATPTSINMPPGTTKPEWIYEFVYNATNPAVMGIGHAATRDFLSFLKYSAKDDVGNPNPVANYVHDIYSWGRSQGGRVERDFLYYGFNQDESRRRVFDGMMPYGTGSGGLMWMNFRFSQPTVSAQQHSRKFAHEPEEPHTLAITSDPITRQSNGVLRRCQQTNTCPKYFNIDSANEYWNKSSSLNHTTSFGEDIDVDKLDNNTRTYFIASIQHNTVFNALPAFSSDCQQMVNPLYNGPVFRALSVALDQWVTLGVEPPSSVVPMNRNGTLVPPQMVNYPRIPATHYAGWPATPVFEFSPKVMNVNLLLNFDVVPYAPTGPVYTTLVPQVDEDGNDIAGIRLPFLEVPLGTFTGWGMLAPNPPDICQQLGQFIPFANTKAERLAAHDPRLSVQERYKSNADFVNRVEAASNNLMKRRFLLQEDVERIVQQATAGGTNLWKPVSP